MLTTTMGFGYGPFGRGTFGEGPWPTAPFTSAYPTGETLQYLVTAHRFDDLSEQRVLGADRPRRELRVTYGRVDSADAAAIRSWYAAATGPLGRFVAVNHRTAVPYVVRVSDSVLGTLRGPGPAQTVPALTLAVSRPYPYGLVVLADSPVCYWRLNDTTDQNTAWGINSPAHLSMQVAVVSFGAPSLLRDEPTTTAAGFDPSGAYLQTPWAPGTVLDALGSGALTIECWAAPTTVLSDQVLGPRGEWGLVDQLGAGAGVASRGFALALAAPGRVSARFYGPSGALVLLSPAGVVQAQAPTHLVATLARAGAAAQGALWVNGALVASAQVAFLGPCTNSMGLALAITNSAVPGGPVSGFGDTYVGALQDVALYRQALPADRIQLHYRVGAQP
jgi:hypothetical protein